MFIAKATVEINRPVADAFDYVVDLRNQTEWQRGLMEVLQKETDPQGEQTFIEARKVMGRRLEHVLKRKAVEKNARLVYDGDGPGHDFERELLFEDLGGGRSRVSLELRFTGHGALAAAEGLMQPMALTEITADLHHLRDILEAPASLYDAARELPEHDAPWHHSLEERAEEKS